MIADLPATENRIVQGGLSSTNTNWYSNFFRTEKATYTKGGGNGAAMRVQPHVWCANDLTNPDSYLPHVIRNAVVTHGHLRGIVGATLHAVSLAFVFEEDRIPAPEEWQSFSSAITHLPLLVAEDSDLKTFWLPTWEAESGIKIDEATKMVAEEWKRACEDASRSSLSGKKDYIHFLKHLGGLEPDQRGSGIKAAIFSLAAAWSMRSHETSDILATVANVLASDTDTIATMAGALLGALPSQPEPLDEIQDRELIVADAIRLNAISVGTPTEDFSYPDLLYWQAPKSPLDALGIANDAFVLQGLGVVEPIGETFPTRQGDISYQWFQLNSGQTLLCKRRNNPRPVPAMYLPQPPAVTEGKGRQLESQQRPAPDLFSNVDTAPQVSAPPPNEGVLTLDAATDAAIQSNFSASVIGKHFLRFADLPNGLELTVAYSAIVVKARQARLKKKGLLNL